MPIDRTRFNQWRDDDGSGDVGTKMSRQTIATDVLDPIDVAIQEATTAGRHAHTHEPGGMDPVTLTIAQVAGLADILKKKADATDPRFANSRPVVSVTMEQVVGLAQAVQRMTAAIEALTAKVAALESRPDERESIPHPHNVSHSATGSDPIAISSLGGYPNDGTVFLNGRGAWVSVRDVLDEDK